MGLDAVRQLSWNTTDLSQAQNTSEVWDMRDLRNVCGTVVMTGNPTGTGMILGYVGHPVRTGANTLDWSNNDYGILFNLAPSGTPYRVFLTIPSTQPVSAIQIFYTRSSGSGIVRSIWQTKTGPV